MQAYGYMTAVRILNSICLSQWAVAHTASNFRQVRPSPAIQTHMLELNNYFRQEVLRSVVFVGGLFHSFVSLVRIRPPVAMAGGRRVGVRQVSGSARLAEANERFLPRDVL